MKPFLTTLFTCFSFLLIAQSSMPKADYFEGEIIVKIKPQWGQKCAKSSISIPSIQELISNEAIDRVEKMFPHHQKVNQKRGEKNLVDLSTIYTFKFDPSFDERKIINQLRKDPSVQYAELNYINELTYTPSDSLNPQQWYLEAVNLFQAWEIEKGDTSVSIAIVDTGSDLDHGDLINDFAYNYNDPINGIDDDNDGFIDNFNGWDVANNDNSPGISLFGHGTNVAGIASASTDNKKGISGAGFNTKILTVKIDDETTGRLTGAYQGIVYAADHGAFIINNSWGSPQFSSLAEDIVNYAAINKGCLVIAATGNNGLDMKFYPAAYDQVFSVGSLDNPDTVKTSSNYGYWVDIFAPGESMLTCNAIGGYQYNGGTSMASPLVAGIAGLVKSKFPNYTAEQVAEHMRNSGDDIYAFNDAKYTDKLGSGRINAFKAVSNSTKPGIKLINVTISDNEDDIFSLGDRIIVSGTFRNFLTDATNVSATISTIGDKLEILNPTINLGNINQLDSVSIRSNPFEMVVKSGIDFNEKIDVIITITADNYVREQYFELTANANYITISENNLTLSITSDGGIGFGGDASELGVGIRHLNGNSHLYEGGFIIGNSSSFISNKFRGENQSPDLDFKTTSTVKKAFPQGFPNFKTINIFTDGNSSSPQVSITNNNIVFKNNQAPNSIIYEYVIENLGTLKIEDLYAGLILDWDIANFANNKIEYDSSRKMGISSSTDTSIYCGVKVLTDSIESTHFAIDNLGDASVNGGLNITDGFSDAEKFRVISSRRDVAGTSTPTGNDIIDVNAIGPFSLEPKERKVIAFSVTISGKLSLLNQESDLIESLYTPTDPRGKTILGYMTLSPNPAKDFLNLYIDLADKNSLRLTVYDATGKEVYSREKTSYEKGGHDIQLSIDNWKTGIYFVELRGGRILFQDKFVVAN